MAASTPFSQMSGRRRFHKLAVKLFAVGNLDVLAVRKSAIDDGVGENDAWRDGARNNDMKAAEIEVSANPAAFEGGVSFKSR